MKHQKILEIRDGGTRIVVFAIRMLAENEVQQIYLDGCGFPKDGTSIVVMVLYDQKATNDPYQWHELGLGLRTMQAAHHYIIDHFDELTDGDVVDVQYLLGERPVPKVSERFQRAA